ncbi:MAG: serine hydrolase domain-containing protein [Verrucomicrobiales bacterium]
MIDRSRLTDAFAAILADADALGAAACVWTDDGPVVSLAGGPTSREPSAPAWTESTLVPVWSTIKGPAAATLLLTFDRARLPLTTPVHHVWPELGVDITFAQLLSHQAGSPALDVPASVFDQPAAVIALERQSPAWPPGTAHGYLPRTFGVLLEECVQRLCHAPLAEVWRQIIAQPLDLDVWIGLPESEAARLATVYPGRLSQRLEEKEFAAAYSDSSSLTCRAFSSLTGLQATQDMNRPEARHLAQPAFTGFASAQGLAKFYWALATGADGHFSPAVRLAAETVLVDGPDRVLLMPTAFSAGFQKDPIGPDGGKIRHHYGQSTRAFGHPGAGGSLAFANPDIPFGFAYVTNRIAPGVMPGTPAVSLVTALEPAPTHAHSKS